MGGFLVRVCCGGCRRVPIVQQQPVGYSCGTAHCKSSRQFSRASCIFSCYLCFACPFHNARVDGPKGRIQLSNEIRGGHEIMGLLMLALVFWSTVWAVVVAVAVVIARPVGLHDLTWGHVVFNRWRRMQSSTTSTS